VGFSVPAAEVIGTPSFEAGSMASATADALQTTAIERRLF
jgi:hypothetical protein